MMKLKNQSFKRFCVAIIVVFLMLATIVLGTTLNVSAQAYALSDSDANSIQTTSYDLTEYNIEQVSNELFGNVKIKSSEYLYNLDDSADYIYVEFEDNGYAVYLKQTMELLEYSPQGKLNYPNSYSNKYYGGPSFYLFKEKDYFVDTVSQECLYVTKESAQTYSNDVREVLLNNYKTRTSETNIKFDYTLNNNVGNEVLADTEAQSQYGIVDDVPIGEKPKLDTSSLIRLTDGTYIPNYRYFAIGPRHGNNSNGTCGAVAAQLMLSYHNYYSDRRIIANEYLNGSVTSPSQNPNYCSDPMYMTYYTLGTRGYNENGSDDANSYFHHVVNNIPANATTSTVKNGINNILKARNNEISGNINYTLNSKTGGWFFGTLSVSSSGIISELDSGRPVLLLMQKSLGGSDHYVVAYGYNNYTYPGSTDSYLGYITHFGWGSGYLNIWVNSSWCYSYITLKVNHTHNYYKEGAIGSTGRTEYKCSECNHRTDAAINMSANDRYIERIATIPQNGYAYKDYYVKFNTAGNKLFQTFGPKDVKMFLFDSNYNRLAYNDDSGYSLNSLFNYNVEANKPYILRVQLYSQYDNSGNVNPGTIKIGITPSDSVNSEYEDIWHIKATNPGFSWGSRLNTTKVICFTPETSGTYKLQTNSPDGIDTYLYFVDPYSTDACLYNDDSAGNLQALIQTDLVSNRRYFIIVSAFNISTKSGSMGLSIRKIS
ncbi:hypothetical protein [Bacteroides acidifaciens]|uniref:hypothetical protein n=1 Tax=Bacteroides acidifaciens TaxID=85831 RepID=UPI002557E857|nr:hypothetical protein [Bacteroides acidifaciens]